METSSVPLFRALEASEEFHYNARAYKPFAISREIQEAAIRSTGWEQGKKAGVFYPGSLGCLRLPFPSTYMEMDFVIHHDEYGEELGRQGVLLNPVRGNEFAIMVTTFMYSKMRRSFQVCDINTTAGLILLDENYEFDCLGVDFGLEQKTDEEYDQFMRHLLPYMYAVSLLNCKNVEYREVKGRRPKNRLGKPGVRHSEIVLPASAYSRSTPGEPGVKGKVAFHKVRGHFATYTPEKPLFGKLVGRYWIPSHIRGDTKNGIVESAYRIEK